MTKELMEQLRELAFGGSLTRDSALALGVCVSCQEKAEPRCTTELGKKEYQQSALCEVCFDKWTEDTANDGG